MARKTGPETRHGNIKSAILNRKYIDSNGGCYIVMLVNSGGFR